MSTYQLGFIGTGNMGGALAQAAAKSGAGMLLSNRTADKAVRLAAELGCAAGTNLEVAEGCKYIFLGVKPQMLQALLAELNRQKDKKGRPYHFALTTWDEEGIALPSDAA